MNALTNGFTLTVENNGATYHSLTDWGLAISNNNYIGEPEMVTNYVEVAGRNGLLDLSEAVTGFPTYTSRKIHIEVGGKEDRMDWDGIISNLRNQVHGRKCKIIFDNDPNFYWLGRVTLDDFDRVRELGTFSINMKADPVKYAVTSSNEPWLWDPFDFEEGVITYSDEEVNNNTITIPAGNIAVVPSFVVRAIYSESLTMQIGSKVKNLVVGTNRFPDIRIYGETETEIKFTGHAHLSIVYRGESL